MAFYVIIFVLMLLTLTGYLCIAEPTKHPDRNTATVYTYSNFPSLQEVTMLDVTFDPDKTLCCSVESGHTLVHSPGGRGYGLAATPITSGCYQWKV